MEARVKQLIVEYLMSLYKEKRELAKKHDETCEKVYLNEWLNCTIIQTGAMNILKIMFSFEEYNEITDDLMDAISKLK